MSDDVETTEPWEPTVSEAFEILHDLRYEAENHGTSTRAGGTFERGARLVEYLMWKAINPDG